MHRGWRKKRERQGRGEGRERKGKDGELLFILPGVAEAFPPRGRKPIKPGCPAARMYRKWNCSRKCLYYLSRVKIPSAAGFFMNKKDLPSRSTFVARVLTGSNIVAYIGWYRDITFLIIHRVEERKRIRSFSSYLEVVLEESRESAEFNRKLNGSFSRFHCRRAWNSSPWTYVERW